MLLYYFALKSTSRKLMGNTGVLTYSVVSKLPWLFALAAWPELGTWTRGYHFVEGRTGHRAWDIGDPKLGDAAPLRARYGLARTLPLQYAVEQRRGWVPHESCPPRGVNDVWDERRSVILMKPRPGKKAKSRLVLTDGGWEGSGAIEGRTPAYQFESGRHRIDLEDVRWADWDHDGRLLVATRTGKLQILDVDADALPVLREHALDTLIPSPEPAPAWAQRW